MRTLLWNKSAGWDADAAEGARKLEAALGAPPKLELVPTLFRPALAHEVLPEREDEHRVYRVRIGGVVVRFVEDWHGLQMTVEGDFPSEAVEQLRNELTEKLAALELVPASHREIVTK
jgi:hypothetical protein